MRRLLALAAVSALACASQGVQPAAERTVGSAAPATMAGAPTPPVGSAARRIAGPAGPSARLFEEAAPRSGGDETMRIHFIDVGQGDATLFEFPCGAILIDSGGETVGDFRSNERIQAYLDAFFARRTDLERTLHLFALTHPHVDHTRAALLVKDRYAVRHVVDNTVDGGSGGSQQSGLRSWARANGVTYTPVVSARIQPSTPDDTTDGVLPSVEPIAPVPACTEPAGLPAEVTFLAGFGGDAFSKANDHSVVARVDFGDASALLTGDLERVGIAALIEKYADSDLLDVDVFQVGHHGSHNATTQALVELVSPKLAVFSAGDPARRAGTFNAFRFGHPNHKAVRILDDPSTGVRCNRASVEVPVGIKGAFRDRPPVWERWVLESALFSTGWDGDVVVSASGTGLLSLETGEQGASHGFACP